MQKAKKYAKSLLILEGIGAVLLIAMIVLIVRADGTSSSDPKSTSSSLISLFILLAIIAIRIAQLVLGILMAINCTGNSGLQIFVWVSVVTVFLGIGLLLFIAAIKVLDNKDTNINRPPVVAE